MHATNHRFQIYAEKTEVKGEIDKSMIIGGDFKTSVIYRKSNLQIKKIYKVLNDSDNTIN